MLKMLKELTSKINSDPDHDNLPKSILEDLAKFLSIDCVLFLKPHPVTSDENDYYIETISYQTNRHDKPLLDDDTPETLIIPTTALKTWLNNDKHSASITIHSSAFTSAQQYRFNLLGINALQLIPLVIDLNIWGILAIGDHDSNRHWSEDELLLSWHVLSNLRNHDLKASYLKTIKEETTKADQAYEICANALTKSSEFAIVAEKSSLAMRDFLAHTSHEIRTPLNAIIGMTELVLDTKLTSEQTDYLRNSLIASKNLLKLINDILDLTKINAGKIVLENTIFNTRSIIESCAQIMVNHATEKKLDLICRINPKVPEFIIGDSNRLKQIIINLLGNAIKFTEHGYVALTVDVVSLSSDGVMLHFTILDTGVGIPQEKHSQIFDSFVQADQSTSRQYGGTGLGLTITKKLIELMSGQLTLESKVAQGSKFAFFLSFILPANQPATSAINKKYLTGVNVLIAESNDLNQQVLSDLLIDWGAKIFLAKNKAELYNTLMHNNTDQSVINIIIINPYLFDDNALVDIQKINKLVHPTKAHILLSTNPQFSHAYFNLLNPLVTGWLLKPIQTEQLYQTMLKALKRQFKESDNNASTAISITTPLSILIAEDNHINRHLLTVILKKNGHKVTGVDDGQKAVDIVKQHPFDLVIMDVQMPVLDGLEATKMIRSHEQSTKKHLPIIAMTANAFQEDRKECLDAGMDDFLTKPIEREKLLLLLNRIANQIGK